MSKHTVMSKCTLYIAMSEYGFIAGENDGHIYCDGGAEVAKKMISEGLIDENTLSVVPLALGGGTELFHKGAFPVGFKLDSTKEFESGLIQKHYLL